MEPSFTSLFKRGKYRSLAPAAESDLEQQSESERELKQEQVERYIAVAIAFCAKYEPAFATYLLTRLCDIGGKSASTPIKISVEPHHWGDLILESDTDDFACIIECKVHAKLRDWQNPENPNFEKTGYGAAILQEYKAKREIHYIVLGWNEILTLPSKGKIAYMQKSWRDLADGFPTSRPLPSDLYSCLSGFGVPAFLLTKTQHMTLGTNTKYLGDALTLLPAVQIETELDQTRPKFECKQPDAESGWYFGVKVRRTKKMNTARGKLQELVKPQTGLPIGWYGYLQNDENNPAVLSVWFYCSTAPSQKAVKERLLRNGVTPSQITPDDGKTTFVEVRASLDSAETERLDGDRAWFAKVLKAAIQP